MFTLPSYQPQQGTKAVMREVGILNYSPSFFLAAPGVNILQAG